MSVINEAPQLCSFARQHSLITRRRMHSLMHRLPVAGGEAGLDLCRSSQGFSDFHPQSKGMHSKADWQLYTLWDWLQTNHKESHCCSLFELMDSSSEQLTCFCVLVCKLYLICSGNAEMRRWFAIVTWLWGRFYNVDFISLYYTLEIPKLPLGCVHDLPLGGFHLTADSLYLFLNVHTLFCHVQNLGFPSQLPHNVIFI